MYSARREATAGTNKTAKLMSMRGRLGLPLTILALTLIGVVGLVATRPELEPVEKPERTWPVSVVEARHGSVQPRLELFGEVVAGRRSELRALVTGPIVGVGENFREGGFVAKGELLLQVDPFDYETALRDEEVLLREARATEEVVRRDLERTLELFDQKNVSEQFLDNARLKVIQQEALVEQRTIELERARRDLRDTRLVAPYAGVLSGVTGNIGKQLNVNDKVADIIDTGRLEARFTLTNAQYGRLLESSEPLVGRAVEVAWQVGDESLGFPGGIARVGAEIAATSGGVPVFATIDSGGPQTPLRPGAFVSVKLPDKAYTQVLRAPDTALYGEDTVYIVEADRMAARRIRIVGYDGSHVLFVSASDPPIRDGDLIITTQLREGGTGARVAVR